MSNPIPISNLYYLLCYAWNALDRDSWIRIDPEKIETPQDLLAKMLSITVKILLKRGLSREYIHCDGEVAGIRGKLAISESISRNLLSRGRTLCSYDEHLADTAANRAILTSMSQLLHCSGIQREIKEELHQLLPYFTEVHLVPLSPALCDNIHLDRNSRYYQFALDICALIARNLRPSEAEGQWLFDDFTRKPAQMNRLFEAFVRYFYQIEQSRYSVSAPKIAWKFIPDKPEDAVYIPEMRSDIVLASSESILIIDTKFYRSALNEYRGKVSLNTANLYQITAYLLNSEDDSEKSMKSTGLLLYPQNGPELNLSYRFGSHQVRVCTVNLHERWEQIRARLLDIVGLYVP